MAPSGALLEALPRWLVLSSASIVAVDLRRGRPARALAALLLPVVAQGYGVLTCSCLRIWSAQQRSFPYSSGSTVNGGP